MKRHGLWTLGAALLTITPFETASAGTKLDDPVTILDATRTFYGSLGSARATADTVQYIGCQTTVTPGGVLTGSCFARNAAGLYRSCTTTDPGRLQAMSSVGSASEVVIVWEEGTGECGRITVRNVSYFAPMVP